ncbi:tRNA lysidine(34) synthetase TilS [Bacillus taeanensis]|uniref:tRNA(Ile)-lysidine synthase n=2 Tax=Bacillus taeanensis TaxID=273032 RepID=A0A366XUN3_9BACI|nr:tRNA lysidine(34) synthetase TilS [Bacillus taeanensis]
MALLHYLLQLKERWQLTIIAAHVDHMFRGEESKEDYRYVEGYCHKNDIVFEGTHLNVTSYKREQKISAQLAARECRYEFFEKIMTKYDAHYLALGHHGDDQIETMLMRQVRGSFGKSRAGMPVKRSFACGEIIRPFLCLEKREIEDYCCRMQLKPRRDPSNEKDDYVRNRFRHSILPFLKKENPNVHERFQQQSEFIYEDEQFLDEVAEKHYRKVIIKKAEDKIIFSVSALQSVPMSLQRRVIHLILKYLYQTIPSSLSSIHIEDLLTLLHAERPSGQLYFPEGLRVVRSYDRCFLTFEQLNKPEPYNLIFDVPGFIDVPSGVLTADIKDYSGQQFPNNLHSCICDVEHITFPLCVRTRQPGDRIAALGINGTKKVKNIFIDQKIDRTKRDSWPIVVDGNGDILWIVGLQKSRLARASTQTKRVLTLMFQN